MPERTYTLDVSRFNSGSRGYVWAQIVDAASGAAIVVKVYGNGANETVKPFMEFPVANARRSYFDKLRNDKLQKGFTMSALIAPPSGTALKIYDEIPNHFHSQAAISELRKGLSVLHGQPFAANVAVTPPDRHDVEGTQDDRDIVNLSHSAPANPIDKFVGLDPFIGSF